MVNVTCVWQSQLWTLTCGWFVILLSHRMLHVRIYVYIFGPFLLPIKCPQWTCFECQSAKLFSLLSSYIDSGKKEKIIIFAVKFSWSPSRFNRLASWYRSVSTHKSYKIIDSDSHFLFCWTIQGLFTIILGLSCVKFCVAYLRLAVLSFGGGNLSFIDDDDQYAVDAGQLRVLGFIPREENVIF